MTSKKEHSERTCVRLTIPQIDLLEEALDTLYDEVYGESVWVDTLTNGTASLAEYDRKLDRINRLVDALIRARPSVRQRCEWLRSLNGRAAVETTYTETAP